MSVTVKAISQFRALISLEQSHPKKRQDNVF